MNVPLVSVGVGGGGGGVKGNREESETCDSVVTASKKSLFSIDSILFNSNESAFKKTKPKVVKKESQSEIQQSFINNPMLHQAAGLFNNTTSATNNPMASLFNVFRACTENLNSVQQQQQHSMFMAGFPMSMAPMFRTYMQHHKNQHYNSNNNSISSAASSSSSSSSSLSPSNSENNKGAGGNSDDENTNDQQTALNSYCAGFNEMMMSKKYVKSGNKSPSSNSTSSTSTTNCQIQAAIQNISNEIAVASAAAAAAAADNVCKNNSSTAGCSSTSNNHPFPAGFNPFFNLSGIGGKLFLLY